MQPVSVVVPAYNEADTVVSTLKVLDRLDEVSEIIVVDDGSTDNTAVLAEKQGAKVLSLEKNRGKGEAVWAGLSRITYPVVALVDADLGFSAGEIKKLIEPVVEGKAEMTVAVFPARRKRGGFGLVKRIARGGVYLLTGKILSEPLSGQRVLKSNTIRSIKRIPQGFGLETALTLAVMRRGYKVKEVEVNMYHRERGKEPASFWHRGRQMLAVLRELWRGAVFR